MPESELDWKQRIQVEFSANVQKLHKAQTAIRELEASIGILAQLGYPLRVEEGFAVKPKQEFPKVLFHIRSGSRTVACQAEMEELGPEWFSSMEEARQAAGMAKQWQRGGIFTKNLPAPIGSMSQFVPVEPPKAEVVPIRRRRTNYSGKPNFPVPAIRMPGVG